MTEETYSYILRVLKVNYSTSNGVIGQLKTSITRFPLSLCMSTLRNDGKLIPDQCTLWDSEKLLYAGKVSSRKLKRILMEADPCRLEITNAREMENGHGDFVCLKDCKSCVNKCPCKAESYWEDLLRRRPEFNKEELKMKKPELKSIVTTAWKNGLKTAKKLIKNGNLFT